MAGTVKADKETRVGDILRNAQKELDALREEIGKYQIVFDSARLIVGHEFVKPLTSISGYVELIEEQLASSIDDRNGKYFQKTKEAIGRLESLVEVFVQMLRFDNRIEQMHDLERTSLRCLVDRVVERFGESGRFIENAVGDDIQELYLGRTSIEMVLENLISNAIKSSTGSTPVRVTAALRRERRGAAKKQLLMVSVEDHGVGIPEHEIKDVFNPFYRIGGTKDTGGLGLGLSLVKSIITIIKGDIHIKSAVGEGTTVTFSVPIPDDVADQPDKIG
jgi:two-component system sensor histidine kinase VicK